MNRNKIQFLFAALIAVMVAVLSASFFVSKPFDTVKVEGGLISGSLNSSGQIHIFKGIPFAAPPVGDLRWEAPQPVVPWHGIKKCNAFGPSPMQTDPVPFGPWSEEYLIPKAPISEDCLYLNVWTGANSAREKLPVLVWIYGGGFMSGGAGVPIYDGEAMAKKGIVFVSINYRVGIFGFFALPELTKESPYNASGNYGLLDQVAALKWVQNNIAAFGGDPTRVTIAGQSAGSMSVNCLVASPLCKGLFKRAIAESGASMVGAGIGKMQTLQQAEQEGLAFGKKINGNSLAELRKIPAKELLKTPLGGSGPIIDGYFLPASIPAIFSEGKQNLVDLLTGWNEGDGIFFGKPPTSDQFIKGLQKQFGNDGTKLLSFYPAKTDAEAASSHIALLRDEQFGIQNYEWANVQSKESGHPVYLYRFARKLPAKGDYVKYGAFHTGEVAYAYDNLRFVQRCPWQPVDYSLEKTMSGYWSNFVKTGNPNSKALPVWPAYNTKENRTMMLDEQPQAKPLPGKAALDFLIRVMTKDK